MFGRLSPFFLQADRALADIHVMIGSDLGSFRVDAAVKLLPVRRGSAYTHDDIAAAGKNVLAKCTNHG